jgi:hypothetical protein
LAGDRGHGPRKPFARRRGRKDDQARGVAVATAEPPQAPAAHRCFFSAERTLVRSVSQGRLISVRPRS